MASKGQITGMLGVYLTAAELSRLGFVVSPTSRSAIGADLLVTDRFCRKAWSVQVKTNRKPTNFWLLNQNVAKLGSDSHIYVFVNIKGKERPEYFVVPSLDVVRLHREEKAKPGSLWYVVMKADIASFLEGWEKVLGRSQDLA
jgi:hypothetical protein